MKFRVIKMEGKYYAQVRAWFMFIPFWKTINRYGDYAYAFKQLGLVPANGCGTKDAADELWRKYAANTYSAFKKKKVVGSYKL